MTGTPAVPMSSSQLIYHKYGTRIAECDEGNDRLQAFAFDGAKALAEAGGWEVLAGPVERVPVGAYDGEDVYAYLWPIARQAAEAVSAR
jgi:hypothetical protein